VSYPIFFITPTERAFRFLRRYTFIHGAPDACPLRPGAYGHSAKVEIEPGPNARSAEGHWLALDWPHDDRRWPTHCACGYAFQEADIWICDQHAIYLTPDSREVSIHFGAFEPGDTRAAPTGALWEAPWLAEFWHGADGKSYILRLPDGHDWTIDGPARGGGGWVRTGEAPLLTALPSIASPGYHGWLTDGVLSDDLEGRSYAWL
jgi:hypothetical protein